MGMDGVELVMDVEETFGITIEDKEAETCETPADLIRLVQTKIATHPAAPCPSLRAFHLLRRAVCQLWSLDRRAVTLDTNLNSLPSTRPMPELWTELRHAVLARSWPKLGRPKWLLTLIWAGGASLFLLLIAPVGGWLAAIAATAFIVVAFHLSRHCRSRLPASRASLRALVPAALSSEAVSWTPDQVAAKVRTSVIEILGIEARLYRDDAHLVRDLGMG